MVSVVMRDGPDGRPVSESVLTPSAEFQRICAALPADLFFLPPQHTPAPVEPSTAPLAPISPRQTHAHRTRPRIPPQSQPTLSPEQQYQVLARVQAGESYRAIAPTFGVSYGTIYRLVQAARKRGAL